ncbi:MAG: hypothetical protein HQL66_00650 [Magnetococcales bacterium]|nr:hypothetical protein [Magnetococcales bacterium]
MTFDLNSLISYASPIIATASVLSSVIPMPANPTSPAGLLVTLVRALACNFGHASCATTGAAPPTVPQSAPPAPLPIPATPAPQMVAVHEVSAALTEIATHLRALHPQTVPTTPAAPTLPPAPPALPTATT